MDDKLMLMIPGPTPVPEQVLSAMAKHPIGHRSGDFGKIVAEVTQNLKWLHQTQNDVLILAASGTGAMEAGIINFLSPGDRVLVGTNGKFGERWAEVTDAYGLQTERLSVDWGKPLDPEAFRQRLESDTDKQIKAVIVTHSETSTGVINDLKTISSYVKAHGALMMADTVTSLGATSVPVDEWSLDVVASGSQKGYMIPPGLGFVAVSAKAWEAYKTAKLPRYYLDLGKYRKSSAKDTTPFTPAINLFYAMQAALRMMKAEGLENIFARHERLRQAARAAVKALNMPLYAADECGSPAITAVMPNGVDAEQIRSVMRKRFDIALAGGQDHLKGKIFRIGHLGFVSDRDLLTAIAALEATLQELGYDSFTPGAGIAAAAKVISNS
ncbi:MULTISPECIES: pyridoxal-phosphate-dependent aminotransferase family protein [Leptolyngbya]|jgi:aspartate aminotransferase-like enzyme|uniref:Small subunit of soluble hydrogenase n=2 Tax=Leptolyngbya boryana TaxID=1184 RepID=A0A1Z4JHN2_LEPBY|nr:MULTISPECIES: alanine--glyoxylate aminotransferase family protein [Leptolyngbya]BAY56249.1 small subunit of soluble hydrogenase [Leptolyngbya boryana NIES-2135]MBD1855841.1 alanine--glyoxylate aminotransferase family protein [Leptolyngbya sp. FACHB-1624]MBD2366356.1 alanine--glyoxylate aminotransferase family protein [Leptolyngbya sp. FACHB-161]MBD2372536.1 alanine--glyoxylate aminotransferase family protein [Leptolyngbya sp. FACHB-238]MBD2396959.1 alanine--glyoxylate aminotransferase famil